MNDKLTARDWVDRVVFGLSYGLLLMLSLGASRVIENIFSSIIAFLNVDIHTRASFPLQILISGVEFIASIIFLITVRRRLFPKGYMKDNRELVSGRLSLAEKGHFLPRYAVLWFAVGLTSHSLGIMIAVIAHTFLPLR